MAENPHLLDQGCPVRPCVIERKLQNCASCGNYDGCEKLAQRLVTYEEVRARVPPMSEALNTFGRLVMDGLRDKAFATADLTLQGHWKAPALTKLQNELACLSVAALSDGLHGELFGDDGWQARFSHYGGAPEEA